MFFEEHFILKFKALFNIVSWLLLIHITEKLLSEYFQYLEMKDGLAKTQNARLQTNGPINLPNAATLTMKHEIKCNTRKSQHFYFLGYIGLNQNSSTNSQCYQSKILVSSNILHYLFLSNTMYTLLIRVTPNFSEKFLFII